MSTHEPDVDEGPVGHDDYALKRVPMDKRYSWFNVAVQRFGQLSALAQFFLAAMIGIGMSFWDAMLAITIGSVILEIVTIFVGIAGMREGLSTSVLARWSGFGKHGSALVGIAMTLSLVGWFGIQNEVFAAGMTQLVPAVPQAVMAMLGGLAVTLIVVYGFKYMGWVAYLSVPAFLALATWSIGSELQKHSISDLMSSPPPGEPISLAVGTTIVAGGFIVGAVMTPDMTRFNRSAGDVIKQTVVGVTLGEYFVGVIGVLLAHALKLTAGSAGSVITIIQSTTGTIGLIILVSSIIKINDWNLYPSSLGLTNAIETLTGARINRVWVACVLGFIGSVLSAVGIASQFETILVTLGVVFPPIAGIMIVDYFILRTWRKELDESRANNDALPSMAPSWVPAGVIAWILGALVGQFVTQFGIPSLNSLFATMVIYYVLGKFGLARGVGIVQTETVAATEPNVINVASAEHKTTS